jgi:glycosyltransferase involved in cell wall biosynthesis
LSTLLELSVIVTTYQRPGHLRRCLLSLAAQQHMAGQFEVIVVDDGSRDSTSEMVARTAREVPYHLRFITHPHDGFQVGRCRNSGIRAARAPYLLFIDGDLVLPPDHLAAQLAARRPGIARAGDCLRLDEETTQRIAEADVLSGRALQRLAPLGKAFARRTHRKMLYYQALRHPAKPKIVGWNMAMGRDEIQRINGFDEQFRGWGCEDDDLGVRLRQSGVRVLSSLGHTHAYHQWHPIDATAPNTWANGVNIQYFQRPLQLSRCLEGIERRSLAGLAVRIQAGPEHADLAREIFPWREQRCASPELDVLVCPVRGMHFSPGADCRVLVLRDQSRPPRSLRRSAHATVVVGPRDDAAGVRRHIETLLGVPTDAREPQAARPSAA